MSIGEVSINFDVVLVDNFVSFCLEDVSNDATSSFDIVLIVLSVCVIFFSGVGVGFVIFYGMLHAQNWRIFRMRHYENSHLVTSLSK